MKDEHTEQYTKPITKNLSYSTRHISSLKTIFYIEL